MSLPPGSDVPPPAYSAVPAEPPKKKTGKIVLIVVAVVLLLVCCGGCGLFLALKPDMVAGFLARVTGNLAQAEVGDCVNAFENVMDARVVDCGSAEAANKVMGVVPNVSEAAFNADEVTALCDPYPASEQVVWIGVKQGAGDVWCLGPIEK